MKNLLKALKTRKKEKLLYPTGWIDYPFIDEYTNHAIKDFSFQLVKNRHPNELKVFDIVVDHLIKQGPKTFKPNTKFETPGLPFGFITELECYEDFVFTNIFIPKFMEYYRHHMERATFRQDELHPREYKLRFLESEETRNKLIEEMQKEGLELTKAERIYNDALLTAAPKIEYIENQKVPKFENRYCEFKSGQIPIEKINEKTLPNVIGFLNNQVNIRPSCLYFGINDDGMVNGVQILEDELDKTLLKISQFIFSKIKPSLTPNECQIRSNQVHSPQGPIPNLFVIEIMVFPPLKDTFFYTELDKKKKSWWRGDGKNHPIDEVEVLERIKFSKSK